MTPATLAMLMGMHDAPAAVLEVLAEQRPPENEDVRCEVTAAILRGAVRFRLAGGVWSASDFAELPVWIQEILVDAGERLAVATAVNAATAARGPVGAGQLLAPIDGGAALREAALDEAMAEARAAALAAMRRIA